MAENCLAKEDGAAGDVPASDAARRWVRTGNNRCTPDDAELNGDVKNSTETRRRARQLVAEHADGYSIRLR